MPTIEFNKSDLEKLLGQKINDTDIHKFFLPVKGEVDGFDNNIIKLDIKDSNRPDLWSVEGIAREMKAHMEIDNKIPNYKFNNSDYCVEIKELDKIRPYGAYAIARNVKITSEILQSLIIMQEKICMSYGKKRKDVAIGIFDLDKVVGKKLKYFASDKNKTFKPLGLNQTLTLSQILEQHPKGKEYGSLIKEYDKYPLLVDEKNNVLSMPPIINSDNSGKVDTNTKNLFIDVTGNNLETINSVLLIICMALADRNATIEKVKVINKKEYFTPIIKEETLEFDKQKIYDYYEIISDKDLVKLLSKKRYGVQFNKNKVIVKYINYRVDIMHPVDVIEDILISAEFNKIANKPINIQTLGALLPSTEWETIVREVAIGLGLQEILTFTLTSKKKQYEQILIEGMPVEIANPMSENIAILREQLFPEHLEFLNQNQHISYPQNIFEFGKIIKTDGKVAQEQNKLCVALCHNNSGFNEAKSILKSLLINIGATDFKTNQKDYPWFINGRSAEVKFRLNGKIKTGFIGEISPIVLNNFNLEMPATLFEIEIDKD